MERISGHAFDKSHTSKLKAVPTRISFYVDGYGAKKSSETLYDIGDRRLHEHLRAQESLSSSQADSLYDHYYAPPSPTVFAEILGYTLSVVELGVISAIEDKFRAGGRPVFPNALLVNQANPMDVELDGKSYNLLESLYPVADDEFSADHFLDVTCEGVIYSAQKIDRKKELAKLHRELKNCDSADSLRLAWIRKNIESLNRGELYYRNRDGSIGNPINFEFSEKFFDAVSDQIGYYSRLGQAKVHWRQDLSDFGEKGVDCDLIMQVMDDLHGGEVDAFVFMTNDMDFFPLIERLRAEGKHVFLCGLQGKVSNKLIETVGKKSFFNLLDDAITKNLPTVFMAIKEPGLRNAALQWAWLAIRREQTGRG